VPFEKTKPISENQNKRNILCARGLWRFGRLETAGKQSQFKANFKPLFGKEAPEMLARYENFPFYDENVIIWARIYFAFLLTWLKYVPIYRLKRTKIVLG
jgi:hypothetical protein